jgi:6-pyruvoyltetrahydropterin/6-carboxytetrahydropterin synthase
MLVRQQFRFEAAHRLPKHPGKCFHLHGHSYRIEVTLTAPVSPETGMTIDFADVESLVRSRVLEVCDHKNFNDFLENPTAENIVVWIWKRLEESLPLASIELWEIEGCSVLYRGEPMP